MDFLLGPKKQYITYDKNEKIRIVFMIQVASFWPSIESFYKACMQDEKFEAKLIFIAESSVEKAQTENTKTFLLENNLPFEIYNEDELRIYKPHIAVYQPPYDVSYRNPEALSIHLKNMGIRIVYVPYGIEIADTEDSRLAHFDTYVVRNSWRIYTFSKMMQAEYQKYCANRLAVRVCGLPKFDAYHENKFRLSSQVLSLKGDRKIILWKMHFPKLIYIDDKQLQVTPYLDEYLKFEKQLYKYKKLFFIVMPHPMFTSHTIQSELAEKAGKLLNQLKLHDNVYIDTSQDYRNSLCNADAIIIDRSALMVEAAVCDVPILYMFNNDYTEELTPPVKILIDTYEKGTTADDMENFLERFINEEKFNMEALSSTVQKVLPYLDGQSGIRIRDDIANSLGNETISAIKLVLFGAGQVCRYYLERLRLLEDKRFEIVAFSDNSSDKWGKEIEGITIVPPVKLKEIVCDLLVITTEQYHMQIKKKLVYELYLDEEKIMRLDYFCELYQCGD